MAARGAKRDAILAAARRLQRAGAPFGLDELLLAAGAGVGTFYHHFPNGREDLERELSAAARAEYEGGVLKVLQRNRDAAGGVRSLVHHQARWGAEHPESAGPLPARPGPELQRAARAWARSVGLERVGGDELLAVTLGPARLLGAAERLAAAAWAAVEALERG